MTGFAVGVHLAGGDLADRSLESVASNLRPWGRPESVRRAASWVLMSTGVIAGDDSGVLVAGDIRLDRHRHLRKFLKAEGALANFREDQVSQGRTELCWIEAAWRFYGEDCFQELSGDFACVVWQPRSMRLVAARDIFGVKPLYWAEADGVMWLSNLPGALLALPGLDRDWDEVAVLDQLLFGRCREAHSTVFRGLRRLPPGRLGWWQGSERGERFLGSGAREVAPIREKWRKGSPDVVRELATLLDSAVARRLPADGSAAVWMSGGLDSTAVAASAVAVGGEPEAHTVSYSRLIPDQEGRLAGLAAGHLGIRHHVHQIDDYRLFERWQQIPASPLPNDPASDAIYHDIDRAALEHSDVALTGFGGDPLLLPERGWWRNLIAAGRGLEAVGRFFGTWRSTGIRPPLGLAGAWARRGLRKQWQAGFPWWLDPDFASRTNALDRWRHFVIQAAKEPSETGEELERSRSCGEFVARGEAVRHSFDDGWSDLFEKLDAGARQVAIERRHPFFDRDVVDFLLSLESLPWCVDKWVLRRAMRSRLPEAITQRRKTPLAGTPWPGASAPPHLLWRQWLTSAPEMARFVDSKAIEKSLADGGEDLGTLQCLAQPLAFTCWRSRSISENPCFKAT